MSSDVDPEDRTEEPTEKRLHDAVERGQAAFSREAPLFASLSAALAALLFVIPGRAATLVAGLVGVIDDPAGWRIARGDDVLALSSPLAAAAAQFLWPVVALLMAAGVVASVAQTTPRFVPGQDSAGFFAHLAAQRVSSPIWHARVRGIRQEPHEIDGGRRHCVHDADEPENRAPERDGRGSGRAARPHSRSRRPDDRRRAGRNARGRERRPRLVASPLAARQPHEQAGTEGGTQAGRGRPDDQGAAAVAASRPLAQAHVVGHPAGHLGGGESDPLRHCHALRAQRGRRPLVVAKGTDLIALKIRAIAEAHDIPVVEDKPLARSLYAAVEVDRPIPADFYRAVAEIVHLIQQRKAGWTQRRH